MRKAIAIYIVAVLIYATLFSLVGCAGNYALHNLKLQYQDIRDAAIIKYYQDEITTEEYLKIKRYGQSFEALHDEAINIKESGGVVTQSTIDELKAIMLQIFATGGGS
jgi:hypothetical protein